MISTPAKFFALYELVRCTDELGPTNYRTAVCRFCARSRTDPGVTFHQRTHLLPELLGKNDCLLVDECDTCNKRSSPFEKDLSTFLLPYRTMLGIKGKKGVPKFHSRTDEHGDSSALKAVYMPGEGLQLTVREPNACVIEPESRTMQLTFNVPSFTPLNVYRSLVKIGLGLMPPSEVTHHQHVFDWLAGRQKNVPYTTQVFVHELRHRYWPVPCAYLYKAKALVHEGAELPEYALVVCSANVVLQIFMPFTNAQWTAHVPGRTLSLTLFPGFAWDKLPSGSCREIKVYDLGVNEVVNYNLPVSFTFDTVDRVEMDAAAAE